MKGDDPAGAADLASGSPERLRLELRVARASFVLDVKGEIELDGVTAIFGPSGSGKTTLLRAIAGLERPERGRVTFADRVWFDSEGGIEIPTHRRPIGLLFQDGRLFEHLDVAGNLAFAEKRAGTGALDRAEVTQALSLASLLERPVSSLSGGEAQRVALARTLLRGPRLLLLDEPLSALDRERKREILPFLEAITKRFRIPTLFVSHDVDDVATLADRVWVLADGRLVRSGSTSSVLERLDQASLLGRFEAGVLLTGRVARHDPRLHLTFVDLHGDEITLPLAQEVDVGESVRLRIRARDVAVATREPEGLSIRNVLPGQIESLERDPESGSVEATIRLRSEHVRARLTIAAVEELDLAVGSSVFALVKSVSFERPG